VSKVNDGRNSWAIFWGHRTWRVHPGASSRELGLAGASSVQDAVEVAHGYDLDVLLQHVALVPGVDDGELAEPEVGKGDVHRFGHRGGVGPLDFDAYRGAASLHGWPGLAGAKAGANRLAKQSRARKMGPVEHAWPAKRSRLLA